MFTRRVHPSALFVMAKTGSHYRVGVETILDYFLERSSFCVLRDGLSRIMFSRNESFFPQLREFLEILFFPMLFKLKIVFYFLLTLQLDIFLKVTIIYSYLNHLTLPIFRKIRAEIP